MINGDARTVVKEGCHIPGVAGVELLQVRFEDGVGDGSKRWRGRNDIGTKAGMGTFGLGRRGRSFGVPDAGVFESPEKVRALGRNPVVVVIGEIALRGYPEPAAW